MRKDRFNKENVVAEILEKLRSPGKEEYHRQVGTEVWVLGFWSEMAGVGLSFPGPFLPGPNYLKSQPGGLTLAHNARTLKGEEQGMFRLLNKGFS